MKYFFRTLIAIAAIVGLSAFSHPGSIDITGNWVVEQAEFMPAMSKEEEGYTELKAAVDEELAKFKGQVSLNFKSDGTYEGNSPEGKESGKYSIINDGKNLVMTSEAAEKSDTVELHSFSNDQLTLGYQMEEGQLLMTFIKQAP